MNKIGYASLVCDTPKSQARPTCHYRIGGQKCLSFEIFKTQFEN